MPVFFDLYLVLKLAAIFFFTLACLWHLRRYPLKPFSRIAIVLFVVVSGFLGSKLWFLIQHFFVFTERRPNLPNDVPRGEVRASFEEFQLFDLP